MVFNNIKLYIVFLPLLNFEDTGAYCNWDAHYDAFTYSLNFIILSFYRSIKEVI